MSAARWRRLHVHLMGGPSPLAADGLPDVLDRFDLVGTTPSLEAMASIAERQEPVPLDGAGAGPRTKALPLDLKVADFPQP